MTEPFRSQDDGATPEPIPGETTPRMPALHLDLLLEVLDENATECPTERLRAIDDSARLAGGSERDVPAEPCEEVVQPGRAFERGGADLLDLLATWWRGCHEEPRTMWIITAMVLATAVLLGRILRMF